MKVKVTTYCAAGAARGYWWQITFYPSRGAAHSGTIKCEPFFASSSGALEEPQALLLDVLGYVDGEITITETPPC